MSFGDRFGPSRSSHSRKESEMGQPVVHFEVIGKDGDKLTSYYSELFGWEIDSNNPMNYGMVTREGNLAPDGSGIGGGGAGGPGGYGSHRPLYAAGAGLDANLP